MTKELMNVDVFDVDTIQVVQGKIEFTGYEEMADQAKQIADLIKNIDITEDNMKESKKVLATVNKAIKKLNDERIKIKNTFMAPYDFFHNQVKMIEEIIKDAEQEQRTKVKEFEELERDKKQREIFELWKSHSEATTSYKRIADMFEFESFLTPKMLNKSTSINEIKTQIATWFAETDKDLTAIEMLPDADEVLVEYRAGANVAESIAIVTRRKQLLAEAEQARKSVDTEEITSDTTPKVYTLYFDDEMAYNFAKSLLDNNKIKYREG